MLPAMSLLSAVAIHSQIMEFTACGSSSWGQWPASSSLIMNPEQCCFSMATLDLESEIGSFMPCTIKTLFSKPSKR
uniref:Uncharacterized protein n=1 Tax=Rhizophora mucronata TaxID=61149 RepID=A0A2P2KGL7_RHIMU